MDSEFASVWNRRIGKGGSKGHSISDTNDKEWIIKPYAGQLKACGEYIAAQFAISMRLDVPEHKAIFLSDSLIEENVELQEDGFLPGYVLGISYEDGHDLEEMEDSPSIMRQVLSGIDHEKAREQAIRIVIVDTAISNFDRHPGTLASDRRFSGHKGNLYFSKSGRSGYKLMAIDFGESFDGGNWSSTSANNWPIEMFGAMKFFFTQSWLTVEHRNIHPTYDSSIKELESLNIDGVITASLKNIPVDWTVSNSSAPPGVPNGNITTADFNNLSQLLTKRACEVNKTIKDKYATIVKGFAFTTAI